ncbi:MAG TPA: orotidine-5'-phosphate decarboxylase [Gemmatimonadetes bacterium]|nr:orotidine-5'-phosphate decarboxylase [Gemmatimonadota bacterium]
MPELIVALDFASQARALAMVDLLDEAADFYKVGLELYTRSGPGVVRELSRRDKRVFLDLKLHDIPNTVSGAVRAATDLGVELLTIHVAGGGRMMRVAAEAAEGRVALLGVTLLTSLSSGDVEDMWGRPISSLRKQVVRLATLSQENGLDGVVASPQEVQALRRRLGKEFLVVTPGIRLPGVDVNDQARVATPSEAAGAGASHLVLGRTVTAAADPAAALEKVRRSLEPAGKSGA